MHRTRLLWVALLAWGAGVPGALAAQTGVESAAGGVEAVAAMSADAARPVPGLAADGSKAGMEDLAEAGAGVGAGSSLGIIRADAAEEASASGSMTPAIGLSAERARLLLRSLTIPGWAQASSGHRKSAIAFGLAEVGVWTSFTAFRIQSHLRKGTSETTAKLFAGVDLSGRDEEYRRIVGSYISSDEYNQLVVYRDAANLHYDDPVAYREYIAGHLVDPADQWSWNSDENLIRYRAQRKDAQRASIRANTALACAVVNRLLSMVHAARIKTSDVPARSWNFEVTPAPSQDAFAYRMGVRARF